MAYRRVIPGLSDNKWTILFLMKMNIRYLFLLLKMNIRLFYFINQNKSRDHIFLTAYAAWLRTDDIGDI